MRYPPVIPVKVSSKGIRSEPILSLGTLTRKIIPSNIRRIEPKYTGIIPSTLTRTTPGHLLPASIPAILGTPSIPTSPASMGGGAIAQAPSPTGGLGSEIGGSLTKIGTGITGTITSYLPLAIKVILAVVVIKIVLWLVRGRRR